MKKVGTIKIKEGSSFYKSLQETSLVAAEKAASEAAERARKEVLERAKKRELEIKAYQDSIRYYDKLVFDNQNLREDVAKVVNRIASLDKRLSAEYKKKEEIRKQILASCAHNMVIERRTSYKDEYDSWHEGNYERKCVECFLVEESFYHPSSNSYGYGSSKKYRNLEKSNVVLLRKVIDGEEYEIGFDDLDWDQISDLRE